MEDSIDFADKEQVWQRMIKNHSRDAHCNEYMALQQGYSAEQQSCSAERLAAFHHHIVIIILLIENNYRTRHPDYERPGGRNI